MYHVYDDGGVHIVLFVDYGVLLLVPGSACVQWSKRWLILECCMEGHRCRKLDKLPELTMLSVHIRCLFMRERNTGAH